MASESFQKEGTDDAIYLSWNCGSGRLAGGFLQLPIL
jgi:hypothetical protein